MIRHLQPLVDGDILRYEIGFAAETGWKATVGDPDAIPPFEYVRELLLSRLETIKDQCRTHLDPKIFLTQGHTFRYDLAKRRPYKGQRVENKPWHFANLTVYLTDVLDAQVVTEIEADDALTLAHLASDGTTILCSRDKDLKQVPGWFYSWELGGQPSFGPNQISHEGSISLSPTTRKLTGTGLAFFYAQVLMGDPADNIPGLPNCGPVRAYSLLAEKTPDEMLEAVKDAYIEEYGIDEYEKELLEQGRLLWMTRRMIDGKPELWEIGMIK